MLNRSQTFANLSYLDAQDYRCWGRKYTEKTVVYTALKARQLDLCVIVLLIWLAIGP